MKYPATILILTIFLTSGCKVTKKMSRTVTDSVSVVQHQEAKETTEVKEFGDTLRAEVPFVEDVPVKIESKGIETEIHVITEKDSTGKIVSKKLKVTASAKPVSVRQSQTIALNNKDEKRSTAVVVNEQITKATKSIWAWVWLMPLFLIIILIAKYFKSIKQFFKI